MLTSRVVKSHASIYATCDQDVSVRRILNRIDGFVELSEVFADACLFDVKNSHRSRLETTGKDRKSRMCRDAERLVDGARKLNDLIKSILVPKPNSIVVADGNYVLFGEVEIHADDRCSVRPQ